MAAPWIWMELIVRNVEFVVFYCGHFELDNTVQHSTDSRLFRGLSRTRTRSPEPVRARSVDNGRSLRTSEFVDTCREQENADERRRKSFACFGGYAMKRTKVCLWNNHVCRTQKSITDLSKHLDRCRPARRHSKQIGNS